MKRRVGPILVLSSLFLLGFAPRAADCAVQRPGAPNRVISVEYAAQPGGSVVVRLLFEQALREPPGVYSTHHPQANVVLDFADTGSELGRQPMEVRQHALRSVQVLRVGARTRVIASLTAPVKYDIALRDRELLLTLHRPAPAAPRSALGRPFAPAEAGAPKHGVRDVGFERGAGGAGRVIVALSGAAPTEVRRQGNALIVDFFDSSLPPELERRLDVQDFGTAVRAIETYRLGNDVRMRIELEGAGDYAAYRIGPRLIVSPGR